MAVIYTLAYVWNTPRFTTYIFIPLDRSKRENRSNKRRAAQTRKKFKLIKRH